jgi:hypothetical protein
MKIKLTLFILFLLQAVSFKAQNLVVNGGFEDIGNDGKPSGWTYDGTFEVSSVVPSGVTGVNSLDANILSGSGYAMQENIPVQAGKTYTLSFQYYVYRSPSNEATSGIQVQYAWVRSTGGGAGASVRSSYLSCLDEWIEYTADITSHNAAASVKIFIMLSGGIGVYIDDVKLVEKSEVITGTSSAIKAQSLFVRSENGNLVVSGAPAGSRIDVYNVVGSRLQSAVAAQGETVIPNLPKGQVLIVRSGNEAAKVAL